LDGAQGSHVIIGKKEYLNMCSNNYLGLANHPKVRQAAIDAIKKFGVGGRSGQVYCWYNVSSR
ncbi:glycine C-acetyltransferase, partial [mine drainage metagenome]